MDNRMVKMGVVCVGFMVAALRLVAVGSEGAGGRGREASLPLDKLAAATVNAKEHGVVGDGQIDDTQALQAALNAAEKKGPVCFLPAGQYRIDGSLVVPPGVTLCGASGGVPHSEHPIGTVLLAYGGKGKADGGRLGVTGCEFMDAGKKAIVLEKGLKAATITGCLLRGEDGIVNESGADVQAGMNTTQ